MFEGVPNTSQVFFSFHIAMYLQILMKVSKLMDASKEKIGGVKKLHSLNPLSANPTKWSNTLNSKDIDTRMSS